MEVGLGSYDFMLDGDPVPPPQKGGTAPSPIFGPCPLWPNGWLDQDGTWHGRGPWSRPYCATLGTRSPAQKGDRAPSPIFGPFLLWSNGWMHQDATWYRGRPRPWGLCARWGPSPLPQKGTEPSNFWLMSIAVKGLYGSRCHLVRI